MVSPAELITFVGLPLLAGLALAVGLHVLHVPTATSAGCWVAVVLTYWLRFALDEALANGQPLFASGGVSEPMLAAGKTILIPTTAIQWVPWCATALFLLFGPMTSFRERITVGLNGKEDNSTRHDLRSDRAQRNLLGFALVFLVFALTITRMIWTSIYFTDSYSLLLKLGFVSIPACVLGIGSYGFATSLPIQMRASKQVLILTLAVCSCGILATSGTLKYAMLGTSGISAACIPLVLVRRTAANFPAEGVILSAAIGLPLVLGYFFAEVSNASIVLCGLSFACTMLLKYCQHPGWKSPAIVLLLAVPALIALSISGYGFYMEVFAEPANPYGN